MNNHPVTSNPSTENLTLTNSAEFHSQINQIKAIPEIEINGKRFSLAPKKVIGNFKFSEYNIA